MELIFSGGKPCFPFGKHNLYFISEQTDKANGIELGVAKEIAGLIKEKYGDLSAATVGTGKEGIKSTHDARRYCVRNNGGVYYLEIK
ncbi:MAG: hypothetical protein WC752_00810 [Patescibacteria group bacterium]|jgi:hypothetical protein